MGLFSKRGALLDSAFMMVGFDITSFTVLFFDGDL